MKKGNSYELTIENTEFPAMGIAHYGDKKVYVKAGLPGQKILGKISKKKKETIEAKIEEILKDVDYKIEARCPHFGICGGCIHQNVPYEKQLELKKSQVLQLLNDNNIADYEFLGIEGSPEEYEYRNKMEFSFGDMEKGGDLTLGMHASGRFGVLSTPDCKLVDEDFRIILKETLEYFKAKGLTYYRILSHIGYLRNIIIRKAKNTKEILINIVTTSQIDFDLNEITDKLLKLNYKGCVKGIIHTINDNLSDAVVADKVEVLYGTDYITENILGLNFKISPFSFFQTNSKGAEKLYSIVKDFMGDASSKVVFDLYCGTGTIGQIAAQKASKVIGIELIEEAVKAANENAALNGLDNCEFIAGDVAKVIQTIETKPDIIILDPPRPGVHPKALEYVAKFEPDTIIYVSCNPKSLVVDLAQLMCKGYKVEKVKIMDMFPNTPHVETVCLIQRG